MSTKVFVGNLNFRTTEEQLGQALAAAGEVRNVFMGTDRETGRSRGFAFVEFATEAEAADAIRRFDGHEIDGRKLRVNAADDRPRRPHGAPPPPTSRPAVNTGGEPAALGGTREFTEADRYGFDPRRTVRGKGSRRGLRARKRSLNF